MKKDTRELINEILTEKNIIEGYEVLLSHLVITIRIHQSRIKRLRRRLNNKWDE